MRCLAQAPLDRVRLGPDHPRRSTGEIWLWTRVGLASRATGATGGDQHTDVVVNGGRNNDGVGQLERLAVSSRRSRSHRGRLTIARYREEGETPDERECVRNRRLDVTRWEDRRLSKRRGDRSLIASPMTVLQCSLCAELVRVALVAQTDDSTCVDDG